MQVLITGGAGFLGSRLARRLLEVGSLRDAKGEHVPIERITLVDIVAPSPIDDPRIVVLTGDISDPTLLDDAIDGNTSSIFHLAAIVSGVVPPGPR